MILDLDRIADDLVETINIVNNLEHIPAPRELLLLKLYTERFKEIPTGAALTFESSIVPTPVSNGGMGFRYMMESISGKWAINFTMSEYESGPNDAMRNRSPRSFWYTPPRPPSTHGGCRVLLKDIEQDMWITALVVDIELADKFDYEAFKHDWVFLKMFLGDPEPYGFQYVSDK